MEGKTPHLFISWPALSYALLPGRLSYAGGVVHLAWDHIDRWQEDPEGVWEAQAEVNSEQIRYQPCRFEPSQRERR